MEDVILLVILVSVLYLLLCLLIARRGAGYYFSVK